MKTKRTNTDVIRQIRKSKQTGEFHLQDVTDDNNNKDMNGILANRKNSPDFFADWFDEILENPDKVLRENASGYKVLDGVLSDPFTRGCWMARENNVINQEFQLNQGNSSDEEYELIDKVIKSLRLQGLITKIIKARAISPQPIVLRYSVLDKYWVPDLIYTISPDRIKFDFEGDVKLLTDDEPIEGVAVNKLNYLVCTEDADYTNPYGKSMMSFLYWMVLITRKGLGFWAVMTENYGLPMLDIEYSQQYIQALEKQHPGIKYNEISTQLVAQIAEMRQKRIVAHPDGIKIDVHEGVTSANSNVPNDLILACKKNISVLITGHEGGAMSTPGKLGGESGAMQIREDIKHADSAYVCKYVNEIIKDIHDLNFASSEAPVFAPRELVDLDRHIKKVDLYSKLRNDHGMIFSDELLGTEFNIPAKQFTIDRTAVKATNTPPAVTKAAAQMFLLKDHINMTKKEDTDSAEKAFKISEMFAAKIIDGKKWEDANDDLNEPIFDFIDSCKTFEEMRDGINDVYDKMEEDKFIDMIERFMIITNMQGSNAADETMDTEDD